MLLETLLVHVLLDSLETLAKFLVDLSHGMRAVWCPKLSTLHVHTIIHSD